MIAEPFVSKVRNSRPDSPSVGDRVVGTPVVGVWLGTGVVGSADGTLVGSKDGPGELGMKVGASEGRNVGKSDGVTVGYLDGSNDGASVGACEGPTTGTCEGLAVSSREGSSVGALVDGRGRDAVIVGHNVGAVVGGVGI